MPASPGTSSVFIISVLGPRGRGGGPPRGAAPAGRRARLACAAAPHHHAPMRNAPPHAVAVRCRWLLPIAAGLTLPGCAGLTYDRVQVGRQLSEYQRVFPEDGVHRTDTTVCYLEHDGLGRTDAVVLLLTRDRQICGKLHAVRVERRYGLAAGTGYRLRGEIAPELARLGATGPIDAARAVADSLTAIDGDRQTREVHGWVAAGLVRLVQRWPHVGDAGPAVPRLTDMLERVPGGGAGHLGVDPAGRYLFEYTLGSPP